MTREHEGLPLEIDVPCVQGPFPSVTDFGQNGSQDVAGVMKDEFQIRAVGSERSLQWHLFPGDHAIIHSAVGVKRVVDIAFFAAFAGHDIDGVV